MQVYIASDHGGYVYKEELKKFLKSKGYEVEDLGNTKLDPKDDYPDFVIPCAEKVATRQAQGEKVFGIVIGRSGNGEAMAANKVRGALAAVCTNSQMAKKAREDNNVNILSLGADYISLDDAKREAEVFLTTPFSDKERHSRRLNKVTGYESSKG
jgi:ribose 5-phosphate isomerase B